VRPDLRKGTNLPQSDATESSDKILTANSAAKRLGVSPSTLRNLVRYGALRADPTADGTLVLRESEIQRFLDRYEKMPQEESSDPNGVDIYVPVAQSSRSHQSRMRTMEPASPVERSHEPKQRCRCGKCDTCQDAARWERIFQEKFADPDYYSRRVPRQSSSLSSLS